MCSEVRFPRWISLGPVRAVGLEGRRYFGMKHWCSVYLKGDISLLLGQMQQQVVRVDEDGLVTTLTDRGRRIIPVTEIEAGGSLCLTRSSMLSAGYLFSAWHDLGFRDQFATETLVESNTTDTANILGFDGLFIRLEVAYSERTTVFGRANGPGRPKRSLRLRRGRPQSGGRPFFVGAGSARRKMRRLARGHEPIAACAALGAKSSAAFGFARLFVEFSDSHFFLDAAALDELAETADRFLSRFFVT